MKIELIGIFVIGGVFAIGLLLLVLLTARDDFTNNNIPKPPKSLKNKKRV